MTGETTADARRPPTRRANHDARRHRPGACRRICEALLRYRRIVVTSHMRPDGDAIGSSLALAWALRELGIDARVVHRDRPPAQLADFPGIGRHRGRRRDPGRTPTPSSCSSAGTSRGPGLAGFDALPVINIDHHPGNTRLRRRALVRRRRGGVRRDGVRHHRRARRAAHRRHGHAAVRRGGDRHGVVPVPGRVAAHVHDLRAAARGGRGPGQRRPQAVRQQHAGPAPPAGRRPADASRSTRAAASRCSRSPTRRWPRPGAPPRKPTA